MAIQSENKLEKQLHVLVVRGRFTVSARSKVTAQVLAKEAGHRMCLLAGGTLPGGSTCVLGLSYRAQEGSTSTPACILLIHLKEGQALENSSQHPGILLTSDTLKKKMLLRKYFFYNGEKCRLLLRYS